ncbi:MAG: hypothetical protein F4213_12225 [Boseongicola sp. SB0677_bin_26]|nr:hypothetical protein [Boseongicola sp. SB0665_bin_10]MYG26770.1 hypothetical protein [Boseongicola sp. SB0677_bin_26]
MATNDLVTALRTELESVLKYVDIELISRSGWGEIDFKSARSDIEDALSISKDLNSMPLEYLTDGIASEIQASIPEVARYLQQIDEFSIASGGSPSENRDNICIQLHSAVDNFRHAASSQIAYLMYKRGDVGESIAKIEQAIAKSQNLYDEAKTWVDEKKAEIEKIESAARTAAASAGVGTFTEEFNGEAEKLQSQSKCWLYSSSGFAVATVFAAVLSYFWPSVDPDAGMSETLRNMASKAAVVVVLFTGAVWCGRIYRALIHQAAVNRHRALSLRTFQAFVEATDDKYVKDAVLMAATNTVFSNVPTGLVEERNNQDSGVNFVEFGRSAAEATAEQLRQG